MRKVLWARLGRRVDVALTNNCIFCHFLEVGPASEKCAYSLV